MFYDGSGKISIKGGLEQKPLEVTAEMRKSMSGNPYIFDVKK
ncbi:hypothetical protein [Mesobacillus foraminis]|uniref:Uncharacterized protein n=1 Tax=Mesobacillus foraminis TaxID=279826 RepID=A0A4R2BED6_9BACI|nr:hypothetical protein [Mesobacillus foraminis]TCN24184.1 hypothetical protein EV146_108300 [Mesobacillus foraminis]